MPQMSPMNWLLLYFFFFLVFMLFNILNYFLFIPQVSTKKTMKNRALASSNYLNWKW